MQPRMQCAQKFASIRRSSSKVSYTALQRRHSLSIAQQLAALPLRHRSGGSAAHHHCTHARKHLFTRRLRPPPCPSISSSFLLLISFAALSFASRLACVTLSRLLSPPPFFPWPMGTVHCAWLRSSASATVVFPFSPPLLALGPLARAGSRSWRRASASPGGRRCEPRAGAAVAHVTHGNSR